MEQIIFNNYVIRRHQLYNRCHELIQNVSDRDYPNKYSFNLEIECLDIDAYVKGTHPEQSRSSVDAVIGICSCRNDRTQINERLLLLEFRMDYKNINNLSSTELIRKIEGTIDILGYDIKINDEYYFLFDNGVINQVKSWFNRKKCEKPNFKYYIAWSVDDFNNNVLSIDDIPYKPIHNEEIISNDIIKYAEMKDWKEYIKIISYWFSVASQYKYKNKHEFNNIKEILLKYWRKYDIDDTKLNENDKLDLQILREDINIQLKN